MRKIGRHLVWGAAALALCGCGAFRATVDDSTIDDGQNVNAQPGEPEPFIPDPATIRTPGGSSMGMESREVDADGVGVDVLVSAFLDALFLDLINPAGPAQSFTYLERLCLEGDEPDLVCRQLYGP